MPMNMSQFLAYQQQIHQASSHPQNMFAPPQQQAINLNDNVNNMMQQQQQQQQQQQNQF